MAEITGIVVSSPSYHHIRKNEEYHIVGGSRNSNHCSIGIVHFLHRERMGR